MFQSVRKIDIGQRCIIGAAMKRLYIPLLLLASCSLVTAGFKLPRHVYRGDKLSEAVSEAEKERKGLAFVLTDEGST